MTKKLKEQFCGVCAAIPLAFAGGGSTVISSKKKDSKNRYNIIYNISIIVTILSVLYIIYYFYISNCKKCKI